MFDVETTINRRKLFKGLGVASAVAASTGLVGTSFTKLFGQTGPGSDTPAEIFTAALIAEDLATVFYYNGLIGGVIMDPNLAGPGGTATNPDQPPAGNPGNVDYLRAALTEEIMHASYLRGQLGISGASSDPYTTFYFAPGTFDTLSPFISLLETLENAFIGAYLVAVRELSNLAVQTGPGKPLGPPGGPFNADQLSYYAQVAASIMGVEAEHRTLGNVINNVNPANNLCFESTDGLTSVYNGSGSAVAALTPFITPSNGNPYTLMDALTHAKSLELPCTGMAPKF
jgi:hypothetical protein